MYFRAFQTRRPEAVIAEGQKEILCLWVFRVNSVSEAISHDCWWIFFAQGCMSVCIVGVARTRGLRDGCRLKLAGVNDDEYIAGDTKLAEVA